MYERIKEIALAKGLRVLKFGEDKVQFALPSGASVTGVWPLRRALDWLQGCPE